MSEKLAVVDLTGRPLGEERQAAPPGTVAPGRKVRMHFSLALQSGELIDDNFGRKPVEFQVGDGNLLPGFEQAIFGLGAGQRASVELPPERAFGRPSEDNVQRFPRYSFPADLALEEGMMFGFADSAGNEQPGVVRGHDSRWVTVDFNHPLAGRTIVFTAQILAVDDRAADE